MKRRRFLRALIVILVCLLVLWAVDLKTDCVPRVAAGVLRQVSRIAPSSESVHDLLGDVYYTYGQCEEGDKAYDRAEFLSRQKAVEENPGDPNAHFYLARQYHYGEPQDLDRAIEHYRHAVELAPEN